MHLVYNLRKKWGILIKKKPESLVFAGLEISRDYYILLEVSYGYTNDITYYFIVYFYNNSNINFCYQNRRERRHFRSL